jgi:hypothetical protein
LRACAPLTAPAAPSEERGEPRSGRRVAVNEAAGAEGGVPLDAPALNSLMALRGRRPEVRGVPYGLSTEGCCDHVKKSPDVAQRPALGWMRLPADVGECDGVACVMMSPEVSYRLAEQRGVVPAAGLTGDCIGSICEMRCAASMTTTSAERKSRGVRSYPSRGCWAERFAVLLTLDRAGLVRVGMAARAPKAGRRLGWATTPRLGSSRFVFHTHTTMYRILDLRT